jgi:hypothetical protein
MRSDVIQFVPHPNVRDFRGRVFWHIRHDPDQIYFRRWAEELPWDDRTENRIINRYRAIRGCFLVEVRCCAPDAQTISFYHEPLPDPEIPALPSPTTEAAVGDLGIAAHIKRAEEFNAARREIEESALPKQQKRQMQKDLQELENELHMKAVAKLHARMTGRDSK